MLIETLSEIRNVLYEGELEYSTSDTVRGGTNVAAPPEKLVVTIGEPQWWDVARLYHADGKPLPPELSQLLVNADFFLVQLACSFRLEKEMKVDWARFATILRPIKEDAPTPIAFDLHPQEVYDEVQRDVKVKLSPSLKFGEKKEVSLGEVSMEIKYNELLPVITAAGALESTFSWDMEATSKHPLRGARWFHVVVKRPKGAEGVEALFDVVADVVTPKGLFRAAVKEQERMRIARTICT